MFDNNNKIFAYRFVLKLDPYLVALFNLCYDVYVKLEDVTVDHDDVKYAIALFSDDFYEKLGINNDEYLDQEEGQYTYTKGQFFDTLAVHLNSYYLRSDEFVSKLKTKDFLYYFKDKFSIYSTLTKKREVENSLNDKFKTINIISEIIENLSSERLKDSVKTIATIYDFNKAGQYIKVASQENLKPYLLNIQADLLDTELLEFVDIDIDNIWVNYEHELNRNLIFDQDNDEYYVVIDKDSEGKDVVGIKVNDHILLKYNVDPKRYVLKDNYSQYLWLLFKENYFRERPQKFSYDSELIKQFKEKSQEGDFNKLLCNLKHNLYIDRSIEIKENYQCFFEKFIVIKDLTDLSNFNFFLPDEEGERELLGIYAEQKIRKKYNLLHYLKHQDDKHTLGFINSEPQKKEKIKVHILKAELSFYLVEKYYEDLIEDMLNELNVDFVSNVELSINGKSKAEFDFVIFKDDKFYCLEAKTTLNKDNVYDTSKKYNNNIEYLKQITDNNLQNFSFILLGFLSDQNLDNYRHFFINQDYNTARDGFAVTPYKFKIPFFGHQDLELECIAEPEILKLKEFIKDICQI
ncbi:hypothetical protein QF023_003414 [Chryseobacterium sp. SLBN-27]|uniref:hypothetical protein n=1 Tax=Chryseobacterium sp. SLBN-27 TaxID=3042287 RepID=UPI002859DE12|nr:hypothetical protein [Chryseobacterium sp. SLBN-27]MDR6159898.1 hypothetical protein [Chryseobacterium sp. SLBN-27]